MDPALEQLVWARAGRRCEYCQVPQDHDPNPFQIDHVIAVSHGGPTRAGNLALACFLCNSFKGPNLSGVDPKTRRVTPLFNPRRHKWARHFRWRGAELVGLTPAGRATVVTLRINLPYRAELRSTLIHEGAFPPE